jgi:hypothetical protein
MARPKHRRCHTCNGVTARYLRTDRQGPFSIAVWVRDPQRGEATPNRGGPSFCTEHAPDAAPREPYTFTPVPALPPVTADDVLRVAAQDETLDDDAFLLVSRALRGADPLAG